MLDTVSFSQDTFHATIRLSALIDFPMENLRKIFKLMLWDDRVNERAIQDTTLFLESIVPGSKAAWHAASVKYQQEWRLIEKPTTVRRTKAQIQKPLPSGPTMMSSPGPSKRPKANMSAG